MTWLNLSTIDVIKFRQGYKPIEYHDIITFAKDSAFMYPRVIEPISTNFQDRHQLANFLNQWKEYFDLEEDIHDIINYAFMPGPGEIRPTHVVYRYDLFNGLDKPRKQLVMKVVDSHYGHQEYRQQEKIYNMGFPTPKPYLFCNYFTEFELLIKKHRNDQASNIPEINWALAFLREIETKKRLFSDLKKLENNSRMRDLVKSFLNRKVGSVDLLEKFKDDLASLGEGIFDGLAFKGFLFMEYLDNTISFEQLLFNELGGMELERASGASQVLPLKPQITPKPDLIHGIIDLIVRLWNMGERHNDLKGEHLLYDHVNRKWNLIDWGELVKGPIGRDLAVLLADTNAFVKDRCKFNIVYARKVGVNETPLNKLFGGILLKNSQFWDRFLDELSNRAPTSVFQDARRILEDRNLTFEASKLERYC